MIVAATFAAASRDELGRLARRHVLEHDAQPGEVAHELRRACASTKTRSRSNMSTSASVTSPCSESTTPVLLHRRERWRRALERRHARVRIRRRARRVVLDRDDRARRLRRSRSRPAGVSSVRYSVISGVEAASPARAARPGSGRGRRAPAATVVTGGLRFGMTIARPKTRAVAPTTAASAAPSRRCRCQSSGRRQREAGCGGAREILEYRAIIR